MAAAAISFNTINLNYLTDKEGKKTEVAIPIELWQEITEIIEVSLKQKPKKDFEELAAIEKGEIPVVTLSGFLDEL